MPNSSGMLRCSTASRLIWECGAMWVVDYRGLTVKEVQEAPSWRSQAGASMKVYKNTLMHIARAAQASTLDDMLRWSSAFVFAGDDVAASARP